MPRQVKQAAWVGVGCVAMNSLVRRGQRVNGCEWVVATVVVVAAGGWQLVAGGWQFMC